MNKFKEYRKLSLPDIEKEILKFWDTHDIFNKSITSRSDAQPYVFFEGPPSANGLPGIHHVMGRTIKDIFLRYKTMKGHRVDRKAGWDTHGLPVELKVEKELGITKEEIGTKISEADYNKACKEAVMRYTDVWNELTKKIGFWVDTEDPYITYTSKYIETVWWLIAQLAKKDLLYKGYKIQPYSPAAGTGLSSHELNQPGCYREVKDTSIIAQFKAIEDTLPQPLKGYGAIHFSAWTTTPWTLPANTALTVGEHITYALIKTYNQYTLEPIHLVMASDLISKNFKGNYLQSETDFEFSTQKKGTKLPYYILKELKGKELLGIRYQQLLPYHQPYQNPQHAFRVISGDFVSTGDGTGIVHTAPTFGEDDARAAKQANPEVPHMLVLNEDGCPTPLVDLQGRFIQGLGELSGKYVKNEYYEEGQAPDKSVDIEIAIQLKEQNKAFLVEKYAHNYPHCWRTDKPVLYYPLDSWFIKVSHIKERLVELNNQINWKPKATGTGRFGNWLASASDWNLSRSRFWGIPIPIWNTEDGNEQIIIDSLETLKKEIQKSISKGFMSEDIYENFVVGDMSDQNYDAIDLHKNIVDQIVLVSNSGQPMKRESHVIDVWFDSGAMPYAQWHYPFENKEKIDGNTHFPADFIAEGVDQTRGWFYTLHAIATMVFDSVAYKNVVSNGLVLDKDGKKMSKRLGNVIDPFKTVNQHSADATRWYMISNANLWENLKFDLAGVEEVKRKFYGTLYNTYSFFALYANIDQFNHQEDEIPLNKRPEIDRWILSELNTLIKKVDEYYSDYEPTKVAKSIESFVIDSLSNWYVRLCRRRFWRGDYQEDKIAAYQTLYQCLVTVAKLSASISPFFSEQLFKDLNTTTNKEPFESVHLADFPTCDDAKIDVALERKNQKTKTICSLVLALRKEHQIRVRQPLNQILVSCHNETDKQEVLSMEHIIKAELNIKALKIVDGTSNILVKQALPDFKILGPKLGKHMNQVSQRIKDLNQEEIRHLESEGHLELSDLSQPYTLLLEEVLISSKDIEGWLVASERGVTVALDITITDELKLEGLSRDFVNRIQNLRKNLGFEVTDRIQMKVSGDALLLESIKTNGAYIKEETLADIIELVAETQDSHEIAFEEVLGQVEIVKSHL